MYTSTDQSARFGVLISLKPLTLSRALLSSPLSSPQIPRSEPHAHSDERMLSPLAASVLPHFAPDVSSVTSQVNCIHSCLWGIPYFRFPLNLDGAFRGFTCCLNIYLYMTLVQLLLLKCMGGWYLPLASSNDLFYCFIHVKCPGRP